MFRRILERQLPVVSFFLFGPRQVGKTNLLKKILSLIYVDLLDTEEQLAFNKTPSILIDRLKTFAGPGTIIIDEIQRVPKLLDVIHKLMEERPELQFIMSGSSARKLRHGASNLLGGRALYKTLNPLTLEEMAETFNLDDVLAFGSLPKIWTTLKNGDEALVAELLRSYVITYMKEEIKSEALVRNLQGFQNFLDVAAAQFAEQVNLSGISRDCQVAYATVREFYSILEDTLMGFFLYPYIKGIRKRMSHQPKFYFFDNGVTRAILGSVKTRPTAIELGRLFEQWFLLEVQRLNEYSEKGWKLYFWRTSHGAEVDLIIEANGKPLAAVECKYKKTIGVSDLSGLASFHDNFPGVPCFIVAPIKHPLKLDFTDVLAPSELLGKLKNL